MEPDQMKTVPFIAVLLVSLFLLVAGASADTLQVQNVKVTSIGATVPVNIVLDTSPAGIAGYDITVSLSNPSVAKIIQVSFPSWAILNESTTFPASSVRLRTTDLYEKVESGAPNIPFGTITLRGDAVGSTDIIVTIKNITSDDGNSFSPAVQSGKFTVVSGSSTPSSPASPVKLIFIHHSTGQNWLADNNGGLGIALRDNNYFVSDTNYGWGPDSIGDSTDIPNWYEWFRGPNSATYLSALYSESDQHSTYSRLASDPGGVNKIVMFKSCFPNSALTGDPGDPIPDISENPFDLSISSAKGIYIDILQYFATKQDTLFIVITAPPLSDGTYSKNARAFNQWLVNDWLTDYPYKNVYVFDFYNVLTTNGGSYSVNDLGATSGNHHRWWEGAVQHQVSLAYNTSAYSSGGDDHPSKAGNLKATAEYIPLLNYAYNQWGGEETGNSANPSISADGRYAAFDSAATSLVSGDTNGVRDVFVRDRIAGATYLISKSSAGVEGDTASYRPSFSSDGRYVAFHSYATNLVSGDTNGKEDVFVRDRQTGTTMLVSKDSAGVVGNDHSYVASISADGRYVAFVSVATNLVAGDSNGAEDVFVRDRQTGTTWLVSRNSAGVEGDAGSSVPSISTDGRYVTFESDATNLVAGDTNGKTDVFVRDRQTGTTTLVSKNSAGVEGNDHAYDPSISADGRYVAFWSPATNLVTGDTNAALDIFVRDRNTGTTWRVSKSSAGVEGDAGSTYSKISADGRYVTFNSEATNLVAGDTNGYADIFVRDRQTGTTTLVSKNSAGVQGEYASYSATISADGRYVVFQSVATNLVTGDTNGIRDIFVRDRQTGTTYLVSRS
jgi:hypothetical protein